MIIAQSIKNIPYNKSTVISVGMFDGVHLAHQKILNEVIYQSKKNNYRSIIITFDPHPQEILNRKETKIELLTTVKERQKLCDQYGIDYFLTINFDKFFSELSFRDFYIEYLINGTGLKLVVEGYNHHWGRDRKGNIQVLKQLSNEFNFDFVCVQPVEYDNQIVSSSLIRQELKNGNVERASVLLNRPYSIYGVIVEGDKRGRTLGFPTANIAIDNEKKVLPKNGIYFVEVGIEGKNYFGLSNIGIKPTFSSNNERTVEVYIFDFDDNIYGAEIEIKFINRIRDEIKFESEKQLIDQLKRDKEFSNQLKMEYLKKIEYIHKN